MSQASILFEEALANANKILKVPRLELIEDNNHKSFLKRLSRRWRLVFMLIFVVNSVVLSECAWFVNAAMTGKGLLELTYPAPAITHCALANIKTYYYLKNEHHVNDLISSLRKLQAMTVSGDLSAEVEKELKERMKFLNKATNIQYWLNVLSIAGFAILPFIVMGMSYLQTGKIEMMMPFVLLLPFDVFDKYIYPFMYFLDMHAATMIVFMVLGPDSLFYACGTFIQIQFRYLRYDLERVITRNPDILRLQQEIAVCIKRHKDLIRCVSLMEHIYAKSTLFNVLSSSMLICLTGFNLTASPSKILMMPFLGFVFLVSGQIYLFCYFGDNIMRSSLAISDAVYNSKWYNADKKVKKDLVFILLRARKPCKLTAYGFSDINLTTFSRILSSAWSYFALLSTVNGGNATIDNHK
ncbi:hypothetical protein O0L34_g8876 [Tuta absoluta]|nr:hypothetical protein O0L34_g8876 [Tuta absoluta]